MADYDVIIIGSGPGGYVCAIRCAQLGLKTACVEGRDTLGGTCLNVGCIPSKAMLHASEMYHEAITHFDTMGITEVSPKIDLTKMQAYKQSTVDTNTKGIEFLFKKNKVDVAQGLGQDHRPRRGHGSATRPTRPRTSSSPPAPRRARSRASRSTRRRSSPPPARWS